jgi:hypothetical protein
MMIVVNAASNIPHRMQNSRKQYRMRHHTQIFDEWTQCDMTYTFNTLETSLLKLEGVNKMQRPTV